MWPRAASRHGGTRQKEISRSVASLDMSQHNDAMMTQWNDRGAARSLSGGDHTFHAAFVVSKLRCKVQRTGSDRLLGPPGL
jgi:hypothetical protein